MVGESTTQPRVHHFSTSQVAVARDPRAAAHAHPARRTELGMAAEDALGEAQMQQEYSA